MQENKELLNWAMGYCSRAEHCVYDVSEKLRAMDADEACIEDVVQRLVELDFINELRYAQAFVSDKFRFNKWGKVKIAHALRQKKVASDIIQQALEEIDDAAYESTLLQLIATKQKKQKGTTAQLQAAVVRFALSRGFEYEVIMRVLRF